MSVKQATGVYRGKWEKEKTKKNKKTLLNHGVCFVLGLLFSLAGLNEGFSPFGVAFASTVSGAFSLTASVGAAVGWFLSLDSVPALRYTSAVLAVCVIKNALKSFPKIYETRATALGVAFACTFVTGLAIVLAEGVTAYSFLFCLAEGAVASASAYLFSRVRSSASLKGGISALSSSETTALCICLMLLVLSLRDFAVFGVFPVHIICGLIILICGFYSREAGGAIAGVCAGVTVSLGSGDYYLLALYSLGGLVSGVFSQFGKIPCAVAYVLSGIVSVALVNKAFSYPAFFVELSLTVGFFFVFTLIWGEKANALLKPAAASPVIESIKSDVVRKLKNASEISTEICTSLTSVNDALSKSEKGDIKTVQQKTRERVCGSCGLYDVCWGENLNDTQDAFNTLLNLKKEGVYLEYKTVPVHFAAKCIRTENVSGSFNKLYGEYKLRQRTESRLKEMHNLAVEQFVNVSSLLDSLCHKVTEDIKFDTVLSARVTAAAHSCGFEPLECLCAENSYGKMMIELKIKNSKGKLNVSRLKPRIEALSQRKFELPNLERKDNYILIVYKEKAEYRIISSGVQFCADSERFSGDTFTTFEDDNGMFYAVICDGMGTGTKAALASNLAVMLLEKLIKAGFGIKAAISTVNTSLISKTGDECSVTLDLIAVDLFTGFTQFYKCGASESVVKKNGKFLNIGFSSLPLGIISGLEAGSGTGTLSQGDTVVMFSDGVRDEDKPFLKKELKKFSGEDLKSFNIEITEKMRNSQTGRRDDMTVVMFSVERND